MKKLIILIILLFPSLSFGWGSGVMVSGGGAPAGSCTLYEQALSQDGTGMSFSASTTNKWGGIQYYTESAVSICKVVFYLNTNGDPAGDGYHYRCEIYPIVSNNLSNPGSPIGYSDTIVAENWNNEEVTFVFSTPCSISATTIYGIVLLNTDGTDGADFARVVYDSNGKTAPFDNASEAVCRWDNSGVRNGTYLDSAYIKVYTQ